MWGHFQLCNPLTLPILDKQSVWIPGVGESLSILFRSTKQVNDLSERDDPSLQVHPGPSFEKWINSYVHWWSFLTKRWTLVCLYLDSDVVNKFFSALYCVPTQNHVNKQWDGQRNNNFIHYFQFEDYHHCSFDLYLVKKLSEPSLRFLQVIVMKSRASDKCLSSLSGYDFSLGLNFNQLSFSIFILFVSLPPTAMFLFGLVCWSGSRINLINLLCRSGLWDF